MRPKRDHREMRLPCSHRTAASRDSLGLLDGLTAWTLLLPGEGPKPKETPYETWLDLNLIVASTLSFDRERCFVSFVREAVGRSVRTAGARRPRSPSPLPVRLSLTPLSVDRLSSARVLEHVWHQEALILTTLIRQGRCALC